ncbi:uncharacterized protein LOC119066648 [Bradysia coprophila]|uniref:uncharacterized protein LOC119066648 n=1 Tax=Bradysia coprophila TaxID=38358 RepID=UPI00187D7741|nr:uncharacterized protein LOC119066648 [Bradysia coprophila]
MIGFGSNDSFEVKTVTYDGSDVQNVVRSSGKLIPSIAISGQRSKEIDNAVFEDICMHCNETATNLTLNYMELDVDRITVFSKLSKLTLYYCDLSYEFVKFDQWCPNLTKLEIKNIDFGNDEWYDDWLALIETHKSVTLRSLSLEAGIDDVFAYFKLMENQFPRLQSLFLYFGTETNFTAGRTLLSRFSGRNDKFLTDAERTYRPMYFNQLKKLKIFAYGQCEEIFNFLKISNKKLTELEFCGMIADDLVIQSLLNYSKLSKLQLGCSYVEEEALNQLPGHLPKLMSLTLDTKYLYWNPVSIIKFMEDALRLRRLIVTVDRNNNNFRLDDAFKNRFQALVDGGRRFLQLNITFFESSHSIKFSRKALLDNIDELDSDDTKDDDWLM